VEVYIQRRQRVVSGKMGVVEGLARLVVPVVLAALGELDKAPTSRREKVAAVEVDRLVEALEGKAVVLHMVHNDMDFDIEEEGVVRDSSLH
jgi:hypothetical protein